MAVWRCCCDGPQSREETPRTSRDGCSGSKDIVINRNLTWLTLSVDLPQWGEAFGPLLVEATVSVDHTGNRTESPEEAEAIVAGVRSVLGAAWTESADATPRALAAREILVVAPYNAQVQVVRAALDGAGLPEVRVGTVDLFQGQEAPIVFVSMTASSHGDVPRGMGFLLNRNRLNVAVSRAQWACYLVRSTTLTAFMPASTAGMLELGAFIGLCTP